ncbi:hypothetical protein PR048_011553 [Dryococelus australis]|uniref:Uncharacterized protein n=1 Tax=Dryococelus australis TaxID=614101 RepID=A0ABQ9HLX8_9NEOP|nr:hypothetical protein PR048_011553 [Dryococelus australis]
MHGSRIFVPKCLRQEMVQRIYDGHMGITKCRRKTAEYAVHRAETSESTANENYYKSDDPNLGLLAYRETPLENEFSLSELLFGRKLRTTLPVIRATHQQPEQHHNHEKHCIRDQQLKMHNKANFDKRYGARNLRQLVDELVWIPDLKQNGKVHAQAPFPHSFIDQTKQGVLWRNRVQLITFQLKWMRSSMESQVSSTATPH